MLGTLAHPPIKEAILEVLFTFPSDFNNSSIREYGKKVTSRFPNQEDIFTLRADLRVANAEAIMRREVLGFVGRTSDNNTNIQIRSNGFAFSRLSQTYSSWEKFWPEAFNELSNYVYFLRPSQMLRCSLRFINEIKLPSDSRDLKQFFNLFPNVGAINYPIQNSLLRVELQNESIGGIAIITQAISPPFEPKINVFLDIDVIKNYDVRQDVDFAQLERDFAKLREFKNEIFELSNTQTQLESYNV